MLIHLPSSGAAQSIVYLDLGADLNVISNRIVEDLGLTKDEYKGVAPRSRGRIREPEWQVTLDWQCGEFYRKHTSTFAVLATEYSEEFNIILGRKTIKEASLNDKVFLELAGLQENIAIIKPSTAHDEDSEDGIESLPSLTSGITPSSSASQDELQRSAADVFSDFLLEDGSLIPVFRQAMEKVDATRLERNFARLLGTFALELRADAENAVEFSAVQFIRARAKHIAKCVGFRLDPAREAASQEWRKLLETTVDRAEILESYLQGLDTKQVEKLSDHPSDTSNADSDESGSHFQADLSNQNLQHVKNFILKSTAFKDLCKRFHDFVHQGKANISVPNTGLAVNRTADLPAEKMAADVRISSSSESESVSSSDVSSGDVNDQSHGVLFRGTYILRHILFCIELTSQFLGISRPPISEGYRRVEWTCLCGSRLYDDFKDVVVGGLDGLQSFLNDHDSPRHQSDGLSDGRDQLKEVAFQAALSKPSTHLSVTEPNNADPSMREGNQAQGLRRRRPNGSEISHTHNNGSSTWVLPIYERGRHRTVVRHIPVQADTSDELLLTTLKGQYLATSSRFRRFLTMRAVKKISYVKFVHVPREPDIHKYDDWPSSKYSPPWIYKGIHTKKKRFPLVGHNFLLHLWHNPSHSDPETYRPKLRDRITTGLHRLSRIRSFIQSCVSTVKLAHKKRTDATTQDAGRTEDSQDMELGATHSSATTDIHASTTHEDFGPHWCYVTLRTPKKMGDQLKADDEDPPEAWGLYFEEGFQVHHAFFIVLVLYIIASLGFAIYWCEQYGLVGPSTGSGAFAVASWMVGLASLVVTIWFKWAD